MSRQLYWTDDDYEKSLLDLKKIAESPEPVYGFDDTYPGDKSTSCNHGLCDDKINKKIEGTYRKREHVCPFDQRTEDDKSGCFYYCSYFQGHKKKYKKLPSKKEQVLNFIKEKEENGSRF